jgi:hypothetical protein
MILEHLGYGSPPEPVIGRAQARPVGGDDDVVVDTSSSRLRSRARFEPGYSNLRRPKIKRAAGTPEDFRPPRPSARVGESADEAVTAKAGEATGVPQRAWGLPHSRRLRAMVFGFPSHDPRRTDQAILRWRTFLASPSNALARARTKPPKIGPVTSGRLAGTTRLQPLHSRCVTPRMQPPLPARESNTPRDAPL